MPYTLKAKSDLFFAHAEGELVQPPAVANGENPPTQDQNHLILAVAAILLADAAAHTMIGGITKILAPLGISSNVVAQAFGLSNRGTSTSPNARLKANGIKKAGTPIKVAKGQEAYFRAAYLVKAAQRIQEDVSQGKTIRVALADESLYYRKHEAARKNRLDAAAKVQSAAGLFGPLLGWYLNPMLNNESECIAANGHNFYADEGTLIGLPGAVHPNCGCVAGPPHEGSERNMVNDAVRATFSGARPKTKIRLVS